MRSEAVFGLLHVGDQDLAIPVAQMQEVLTAPTAYTAQPLAAPEALGSFILRGTAVPTTDLRILLGRPAPGPPALVVLLRSDLGLLGLGIDGTSEVLGVAAGAVQPLVAPSGARAPLSALLVLGDRLVPVLDVPALLRHPGLLLRGPAAGAASAGHGRESGAAPAGLRDYLFFDCDSLRFCLEARMVRQVLDLPELDRTYRLGQSYLGMVELRGETLPVLDLLNVLALPAADAPAPLLLVLEMGDRAVGLPVSQVVAMRRLSADQHLPVPRFGLRRPDLVGGVVPAEVAGRDALVLDPDAILLDHAALMEDPSVAALQRLHRGLLAAGAPGRTRPTGRRASFLSFRLGATYAVPMDQVQEIQPMPAAILHLPSADGVVPGLMKRRGAMVPLVRLRQLAGLPDQQPDAATRVLLVASGAAQYGFIVDATLAVEHVQLGDSETHGTSPPHEAGGAVAEVTRLVWTESAAGPGTLTVIDLARLAARLATAVPPPE